VALRWGLIYLAGVVFVVVFTRIAVNEREGRAEVERLAAELGEANRRLREYAAQIEELATAKERNRLAREIHDSLGHYLTVVNVQIEASRAVLDSDRQRALEGMRKAQLLTQEGLAEVRRSVAALRASPVESRPLPESLSALVDESRASGTPTEFILRGSPRTLTPQAALTLYRAAQEALTNVRRHAQASRAEVLLDYRDDASVRLCIRDDGTGGEKFDEGFGLLGVRERAQLLGGTVNISTSRGEGFSLEIELPE
jgi:signal transduction histidine kinase